MKYLLGILGIGISLLPFFWLILKDYQKERIISFINPYTDPLGSGYNIIQSKIAIGSGGIFGKGFLKGTQSQLHFIPVNHTDFIFSVFSEEWGFIGSSILLILYAILVFEGIKIAIRARDMLGTFMAIGLTSMLGSQIVINLGVSLGLLPVTGITLPFVSYGGSSLIVNMAIIGILQNIRFSSQKWYM